MWRPSHSNQHHGQQAPSHHGPAGGYMRPHGHFGGAQPNAQSAIGQSAAATTGETKGAHSSTRKIMDTFGSIHGAVWESTVGEGKQVYGRRVLGDLQYTMRVSPAWMIKSAPEEVVPTELVHKASNKIRSALNAVCFTPDGRRLLTGSNNGEITIWGSHLLNYETTFQAHDSAIRVMRWSHGRDWLISGDNSGDIKYWRRNLSELPSLKAHNSVSIRDLSFAPSDARFVSCGDDAVIKIWSFRTKQEESHLIGHGWDVRTVDWHPFKGIIASGGKDNTIILWDPRSGGRKLTSIHGHHNAIVSVRWNQNGNWFASASRDNLIRVFDIRMMAELQQMRGHQVELGAIVWHPHHESLLTSGSANGQIRHWIVGEENSVAVIDKAHDYAAWALDYHPDGHLLASGSNDTTARIWRPVRPGEYTLNGQRVGKASDYANDEEMEAGDEHMQGMMDSTIGRASAKPLPVIPGLGRQSDYGHMPPQHPPQMLPPRTYHNDSRGGPRLPGF